MRLAYAKAGTYRMRLAYAKAATYPNAARPDRSTLSRRVRGVLSPSRERGIRALARPQDGARSAPSPSYPRGHVIPAKAGTYPTAPRLRASGNLPLHRLAAKAGTYPTAPRNAPPCTVIPA